MSQVQVPAVPILPSILQITFDRRLETFHVVKTHKEIFGVICGAMV